MDFPIEHDYEDPSPQEKHHWWMEARTEQGWEFTSRAPLWTGEDLLSIPQPTWLLPPMLQRRQLSTVAGPSNTFKTFFMVDVAMTLATGAEWSFMSHAAPEREPMPVLFVEAEGADTLAERAQTWLAARGADPKRLPRTLHVAKDLPNLYSDMDRFDGTVDRLLGAIAYEGIQLVIIDTLHATAAGANTNAPEDMNRIVGAMRRIRDEAKSAVSVVHHYNKSGDIGGSNVLFAAMDTVVEFQPDEAKVRSGYGAPESREIVGVWVKTSKQRRYPIKTFGKLVPRVVRYRDAYEDSFEPDIDGTSLVLLREGKSELDAGEHAESFRQFGFSDQERVDRLWEVVKRGPWPSKAQVVKAAKVQKQSGYALLEEMLEKSIIFEWEDGQIAAEAEIDAL